MDPITTVLILLLAVTIFALLASKIGVAYPTMMVVGGLAICFLPNLKMGVCLEPRLIFIIFLPPLLYGAAWQMSWKDFWANRRTISFCRPWVWFSSPPPRHRVHWAMWL